MSDDDSISLPPAESNDEDNDDSISLPSVNGDDILDHVAEFYSPPRVVPMASNMGLRASVSLDLQNGHDFLQAGCCEQSLGYLSTTGVLMLIMSPPCTVFSPLQELWNIHRMNEAKWKQIWEDGVALFKHAVTCAFTQINLGRLFIIEHPVNATSWKLPTTLDLLAHPDTKSVIFDQCAFGAATKVTCTPTRKRTRLLTNSLMVYNMFNKKYCTKDHVHKHLEGSEGGMKRTKWAAQYPPALCQAFVQCVQQEVDMRS
jgi:hypothetical protein